MNECNKCYENEKEPLNKNLDELNPNLRKKAVEQKSSIIQRPYPYPYSYPYFYSYSYPYSYPYPYSYLYAYLKESLTRKLDTCYQEFNEFTDKLGLKETQ